MFHKSTSFWLSLCLTSLVIPVSLVATSKVKVSASSDVLISQANPCAGKDSAAGVDPCAGKDSSAGVDPCAGKDSSAGVDPCAGKDSSAGVDPCAGKNPSAAADPCAGKNPSAGNSTTNVGGPLAKELQGKPVVIDIYASWCSACKNIAPTLSELKEEYEGKANFIVFDVSDKSTASEAEARAKELGLSDFFAQNKAKTGSVTIVDPANGNILAQNYNNANFSDYSSVLNSAISLK